MVTFTTLSASVSCVWFYHTGCTHLFLVGLILVRLWTLGAEIRITFLNSAVVLT